MNATMSTIIINIKIHYKGHLSRWKAERKMWDSQIQIKESGPDWMHVHIRVDSRNVLLMRISFKCSELNAKYRMSFDGISERSILSFSASAPSTIYALFMSHYLWTPWEGEPREMYNFDCSRTYLLLIGIYESIDMVFCRRASWHVNPMIYELICSPRNLTLLRVRKFTASYYILALPLRIDWEIISRSNKQKKKKVNRSKFSIT